MPAPGAITQFCTLVSYALGFAGPRNTPNIGLYGMVSLVDAASSGIKMRVERCTGGGCSSFTHVGDSNGVMYAAGPSPQAEFIDSGVYATLYRYRARLENDDGVGPWSATVDINTTTQGASSCDSGSITDFADETRATAERIITEYDGGGSVRATGERTSTEFTTTEARATGERAITEFLLTRVQATGLRIIYEWVETAQVDLRVEKSNNNPTPFPGDFVTWIIVVTNDSGNDATNVFLSDLLPDGVFYSSHVASKGTYDPVEGVWTIGDLAATESATLELVALVGLIGPNPGDEEICNLAIATSAEDEATPENNVDVDCIVVQPPIGPPTAPCPPENPPPVPPLPPGECPPRQPPDTLNYSVPFRLYQKDFEVRLKSWGDDSAYSLVRPQGGPSFDRGATI